MKNVLFITAAFFLFSCGNSKQKELDQIIQKKLDSTLSQDNFMTQPEKSKEKKQDFISVLKTINISNINQYIHPEKGLWLIQSNGAMPSMTNTSQVDKNFPVDFSSCVQEELPKINCDTKTFWTKDGCFLQQENTFKDEKIWQYVRDKIDASKIEERANSIQWTVINTSLYAKYYFTQIDGKWYLLFADLRKPCEA